MFTINVYCQLLMFCCHCLPCISPFHKNLRSQILLPSPYLPAYMSVNKCISGPSDHEILILQQSIIWISCSCGAHRATQRGQEMKCCPSKVHWRGCSQWFGPNLGICPQLKSVCDAKCREARKSSNTRVQCKPCFGGILINYSQVQF